MNHLQIPLLALLQAAGTTGAADPAFSRDGRLVVSVRGDLWIRETTVERWIPATQGSAWDWDATWDPDGTAIVFVSDRSGNPDLWRLRMGPEGPVGVPERLTDSPESEREPALAPGGALIFVRGRSPTAQLWIRNGSAPERRLTENRSGAERWPAVAPDGKRVAYVLRRAGGDQLRITWLDRDSTVDVLGDREIEYPAWSPQGDRLSFTSRGGRPGVWVTTPTADYVNLLSARPARSAWSPDGRTVALAELPPADPSYNGDPERVGERLAGDVFASRGSLWFVAAPASPAGLDAGPTAAPLPVADRSSVNAVAFDRVWTRVNQLYYTRPAAQASRARWEQLRATYRPRALAAHNDAELETVVHDLLRHRPLYGDSATGWSAVSSAHPVATAAGLEMLRRGGNVVDAAVAVSFALGVVEPDASGVGGYGQMLIGLSGTLQPALIEFMTRVPEAAGLSNATLLENGRYPDDGPVLANVPGTVAAMELAWKQYGGGKLTWSELVEPAIRAAEQGFEVSDGFATTLDVEREHFLKYAGSRALFFPGGQPLAAGDTLRNPDLAWTLRQIADSGARAFYRGEVARRMVTDLRGQGSAMRLSDLARYYAAERQPVAGTYRGYDVYSSTPPSGGGATLVAQLNHLEQWRQPRPFPEHAPTLHAMIESWKLVPSSRGRIADPGLWPVRLDGFVSKDSARARWVCFSPARSLKPSDLSGESPACAEPAPRASPDLGRWEPETTDCGPHCHQAGTTAFVVADASGNAVSVTQTLGTWGGNFYVTPGLGFLYNDKLTSYGTDPGQYGARLPNARHGSSLAPTLVYGNTAGGRQPVLAVGAAGNAWITSAVFAITTGILDHGLSPQQAIEQPRFLPSQRRTEGSREFVVLHEDGLAPAVVAGLQRLGHRLQPVSLRGELREGYAAAITLEPGRVRAAADPRRSGAAGALDRSRP